METMKLERGRKLPAKNGFTNMGFTLLLVVFLVITLVVLALLALSGAKNDLEFSRSLALQRQQYYEACSQSETCLQQVQQRLKTAEEQGREPDFSGLPVEKEENRLFWQIPVDETRVLRAEYDLKTGKIQRWQTESAREWEQDDRVSTWIP